MSDEFLDEYDLHWKLKRAKRCVLLFGVALFIWANWGKTFLILEFVWTCFLSRRHDLPVNATYMHVDLSAAQVGGSFANLLICMCTVWFVCVFIDAFFAPVNLTEAELENRRSSAMRRYRLLIREARTFQPAEKLVAENVVLRSEMSDLHEAIVKLRLEMDRIDRKKTKRTAEANAKAPDLFDQLSRSAEGPTQ